MKSGGANCDFYYATAGHRVKRAAREPRSPGGSLWYSITRSSGRAGPSTEDVVRNIHIAHVHVHVCAGHRSLRVACGGRPVAWARRTRRDGTPHAGASLTASMCESGSASPPAPGQPRPARGREPHPPDGHLALSRCACSPPRRAPQASCSPPAAPTTALSAQLLVLGRFLTVSP